jgi:hypothetical protein
VHYGRRANPQAPLRQGGRAYAGAIRRSSYFSYSADEPTESSDAAG